MPMASKAGTIAVLGSVNFDLNMRVRQLPAPGVTALADQATWTPGGKGANQAVAAARCGAQVQFFGCVGDDQQGAGLLGALRAEHVGTTHIRTAPGTASGIAVVMVEGSGENSIVVAPGANLAVGSDEVSNLIGQLAPGDIVLAQLEVPLGAVARAFELAPAGVVRILNAAPAPEAELGELHHHIDLLIVNEHEASQIYGRRIDTLEKASDAARELSDPSGSGLIITCGAAGSTMAWNGHIVTQPAHHVTAVDTTGAGDCYVGAFAAALWRGMEPQAALAYASIAGALATTRPGAQIAMPTHGDITEEITTTSRRDN